MNIYPASAKNFETSWSLTDGRLDYLVQFSPFVVVEVKGLVRPHKRSAEPRPLDPCWGVAPASHLWKKKLLVVSGPMDHMQHHDTFGADPIEDQVIAERHAPYT